MPDLGPATHPRPNPTPEQHMRDARTDFGTYLDRHERDQLDARAATAEAERDEALDERDYARHCEREALEARDVLRHRTEKAERERDSLARRLGVRFQELEQARTERDEWEQTAGQLAKQLDEMREARDVLRHRLDAMKAEKKRILGRLERAEHAINLIRDGQEQIDRALADWDTAPQGQHDWLPDHDDLCVTCHLPDGKCLASPALRKQQKAATITLDNRHATYTPATPTAHLGSPVARAQDIRPAGWEQQATNAVKAAMFDVPTEVAERWASAAVRAIVDAGLAGHGGRCRNCGTGFPRTLPAASSLGSPSARAQDDLTDRLAAALTEARRRHDGSGLPPGTLEQWRLLLAEYASRAQDQPTRGHEIAFDEDGDWSIGHPDGCPGQAFGDCDVYRLAFDQVDAGFFNRYAGSRFQCTVNDLRDLFLLGDRIHGDRCIAEAASGMACATCGCWCHDAQDPDAPAESAQDGRTGPGEGERTREAARDHDHTTGYPIFAPDAELVVDTIDGPAPWTGAQWNAHVTAATEAGNIVVERLIACPAHVCTTTCPAATAGVQVSSVIAVSNKFARAANGQPRYARAAGHPAGGDWVRLRTGSGRQYEGYRAKDCPGDGVAGHRHDIRCVERAEG